MNSSIMTPLRDATYRGLFFAQSLSLLGTGLSSVALALLAYQLVGEQAGYVLGVALAIKMVAYVGIAPLAGALAPRLPTKTALITLDGIRALLVLLFPFVDAVWQIYALMFMLNAASACFTPLFQALIPTVLPDEARYTRALSLSRLAYDLENLLSPALAALLLVSMSFDTLFVLNAGGFVASALFVATRRLPMIGRVQDSTFMTRLHRGLFTFLRTPRLRGLMALNVAVALIGALVIVTTVNRVRDDLGLADTQVAQAMMAFGAGSMLIALLLPAALARFNDRTVMLSGGLLAIVTLAGGVALPLTFVGLLAIWAVLGMANALIQTPVGRVLRRSSAEEDRPGIFAGQFALSHAGWLLAYPLAGWLGSAVDASVAFMVLAVLVALTVGVAAGCWPRRDLTVLTHSHSPMQHEHTHVHDAHHQHAHEGWEGPEPHRHPHYHEPIRHHHAVVIDLHHPHWPT